MKGKKKKPARKAPKRAPAKAKRNPSKKKTRRNPESVRQMSQDFNCTPNDVVKIPTKDRGPLPKEGMDMGEVHSLTYGPNRNSCRGDSLWKHAFGDRGPFLPKTKHKPHLVAFPDGRFSLVGGDARVNSKEGIVG